MEILAMLYFLLGDFRKGIKYCHEKHLKIAIEIGYRDRRRNGLSQYW